MSSIEKYVFLDIVCANIQLENVIFWDSYSVIIFSVLEEIFYILVNSQSVKLRACLQ